MAGMDVLLERAVKMLFSQLPPETVENVVKLAQIGIELKAQLDRIEAAQAEQRSLLVALVEALQPRTNDHERPALPGRNSESH